VGAESWRVPGCAAMSRGVEDPGDLAFTHNVKCWSAAKYVFSLEQATAPAEAPAELSLLSTSFTKITAENPVPAAGYGIVVELCGEPVLFWTALEIQGRDPSRAVIELRPDWIFDLRTSFGARTAETTIQIAQEVLAAGGFDLLLRETLLLTLKFAVLNPLASVLAWLLTVRSNAPGLPVAQAAVDTLLSVLAVTECGRLRSDPAPERTPLTAVMHGLCERLGSGVEDDTTMQQVLVGLLCGSQLFAGKHAEHVAQLVRCWSKRASEFGQYQVDSLKRMWAECTKAASALVLSRLGSETPEALKHALGDYTVTLCFSRYDTVGSSSSKGEMQRLSKLGTALVDVGALSGVKIHVEYDHNSVPTTNRIQMDGHNCGRFPIVIHMLMLGGERKIGEAEA